MGQGIINERAISVGANKRYRVGVCVPKPGYKVYIPLWWEKVVETTSGLAHFFKKLFPLMGSALVQSFKVTEAEPKRVRHAKCDISHNANGAFLECLQTVRLCLSRLSP